MHGLLKIANENKIKDKDSHIPEAAGATAGLAGGGYLGRYRLTGTQPFFHGTSVDNLPGIVTEGLLASKGGSNGATLEGSGNIDKSVGKVHLTKSHLVGNYHANFHDMPMDELLFNNRHRQDLMMQAPKNGKGVVLYGRIPYARYDKMELDPVFNQKQMKDLGPLAELPFVKRLLRDQASRGEIDVLPIEIAGNDFTMAERLKHYAGEFPGYVKQYPGRFASGAALAGGGALAGGLLAHKMTTGE